MKRKILSWLNKTWHRNFPKLKNPFQSFLFNQRLVDCAVAGLMPGCVLWIGDSRFHQFESEIESQPDHVCVAVSGSKIEDWIPRIDAMIFLARPSVIVDDIGGNNILAGQDRIEVELRKLKLNEHIKDVRYIVTEIPHAGTEIDAALHCNKIFTLFNTWLGQFNPVRLCDVLSPQGYLAPEYDCGDHVHFHPDAWPIIRDRVWRKMNNKEEGQNL